MTELSGRLPTLLRGRYEVLEALGAGGEGRVVKALDHQHERLVVLKVRTVRTEGAREELLREARVLLSLPPHEALPLVRDDFFADDRYVVVMDWVDGIDLARLLRDRGRPGLPPSSVLSYLSEAAKALTFLHSQDLPVVHGDVKPANLILTRGGHVKLVDFGLSSTLGMQGQRSGTIGYRAPELAIGDAPSRASDIFALAATAFALLTGSPPAGVLPEWDGIEPEQAAQLERCLRAGLSTDPANRPATAGELVEALGAGWASTLPTGTMTFCMSDIEGSSALWERDPAAMAESLVRHDELIAEVVQAQDGRFIKSMGEGDSTVAVFTSASNAAAAAIGATRALAAEDWLGQIQVRVRFGLHTGEAQRRGTDYFGTTVNLAARVRGEARGGEILVSRTTAGLLDGTLPPGYGTHDLGLHRLKGMPAAERLFALEGPGLPVAAARECPYRGLLAYEPEDRSVFFGREEVVADVIHRLRPGGLLAVVGASGSGKSSVLRAGVIGPVMTGELSAFRQAVLLTPGPEPPIEIDETAQTLVVVDQFEELYTQCHDAVRRRAFIDALLNLPGPVVIGVRADFYGDLTGHPKLARAVAEDQILLGAMSEDELRRAVAEPARMAGLRLQEGLVDLVLRDVAGEPGALPLMSHALRATWERRDGRTLTVDAYRESGGVSSAVAQTADEVAAATPEDQRWLLRNVFLRLTELGEGVEDTRRRVEVEELVSQGASIAVVKELLQRLADARLLTLGEGTAEVAHEVLIRSWPTLRHWLEEDREGIRLHRRLGDAARLWEASGREPGDLYRGTRLDAALEWAADSPGVLNDSEQAFLDVSRDEVVTSQRAQLRVNRRLRRLAGGIALLLLAALALLVFALVSRHDVVHTEALAQSRALAQESEGQLARDPQVALLLARMALHAAPTPDAELAASEALDANTIRGQTPSLGQQTCTRASQIALLRGGRVAAVTTCDGQVAFENLQGRRILKRVRVGTSAGGLSLDPTGRRLAVAADDGVAFLDATTGKLVSRLKLGFAAESVAYSPGGGELAVTGDAPVVVVDLRTRAIREVGRGDPSYNVVFCVSWAGPQRLLVGTGGGPGGRTNLGFGLNLIDLRNVKSQQIDVAQAGDGAAVERVVVSPRRNVWYVSGAQLSPNGSYAARVWAYAPARHRVLWSAAGPQDEFGSGLAVSADAHLLAVGYGQGTAKVLDASTGRQVILLPGSTDAVRGLAFRSGPVPVVTSSQDGVLRLWSDRGSEQVRLQLPHDPIFGYTSDGRDIAAVGERGAIVTLPGGRLVRSYPGFPARSSSGGCNLACVAYSSNLRWLAYLQPNTRRPTIVVENGVTGQRVGTFSVSRFNGDGLAPNGDVATTYTYGQRVFVRLFSPQGRSIRFFRPARSGVGCSPVTNFSADSRLMVVEDLCHYVAVWDVRSGRLLRETEVMGRLGGTGGANLTPDDRFVVLGLAGGALARIDLRTGQIQERPGANSDPKVSAVSPDGRYYALALTDGSIDVYDARTLRLVRQHLLPSSALGLSFSPGSRHLAALDSSHVLHIWDTCGTCENPQALARRAERESVRTLTTDERATFEVNSGQG